jgi:putative membrane protein
MEILWGTIALRPYVFIFLAVYLLGAGAQFGLRITVSFMIIGYFISFLSELSSIHTGIPYGHYFYIPSTAHRELWVLGVPLMDSLSFVFLSACSYSTAILLLSPVVKGKTGWSLVETTGGLHRTLIAFLGGLLMVLLDVTIDPVALRGRRWFLGQIFGYSTQGDYFGVPLSNFIGWAIVGWILVGSLWALRRLLGGGRLMPRQWPLISWSAWWGAALYICILGFNVAIAFYIGEITLGLCSLFLSLLLLTVGGSLIYYKLSFPLRGTLSSMNEGCHPQRGPKSKRPSGPSSRAS